MPRSMSDAVAFDVLCRVPLFADTPVDELRAVARATHTFWRQKGVSVFEEGGRADGCLALTSGRAKVVLSGARDSEIILGIVAVRGAWRDGASRRLDAKRRPGWPSRRAISSASTARRSSNCERTGRSRIGSCAMSPRWLRRATERLRAIYTYSSTERLAWCLATLARQRGERFGERDCDLAETPASRARGDDGMRS